MVRVLHVSASIPGAVAVALVVLRQWMEKIGELGAGIALMVSSKPRVGLRHCPEHRRKQRILLALSLGAKVSGLYSVLVANRRLVGRNTHREAQILAQQTCQ